MRPIVLAALAFAAMEPVTALTHRFVMHGVGMSLHRSHHRRTHEGWERNDAFPVMFAAVVCVGLWIGFHAPTWAELVPIGVGVTAYGAAYAVVHDVYIHGRLRWFGAHGVRRARPVGRRPRAAPPLRRRPVRHARADRPPRRPSEGQPHGADLMRSLAPEPHCADLVRQLAPEPLSAGQQRASSDSSRSVRIWCDNSHQLSTLRI